MIDLILKIIGFIVPYLSDSRRIRLTVHKAFFEISDQECFFINVTNISRTREIEITHVWFDLNPQVPVINKDRVLPKRLKPDETWETWIGVNSVPTATIDEVFKLARVRLSNGTIIKSRKNNNVPVRGTVPG